MRFVSSQMSILAHDGPVSSFDIPEEKRLFFRACPCLWRVVKSARDQGIRRRRNGKRKVGRRAIHPTYLSRFSDRRYFEFQGDDDGSGPDLAHIRISKRHHTAGTAFRRIGRLKSRF